MRALQPDALPARASAGRVPDAGRRLAALACLVALGACATPPRPSLAPGAGIDSPLELSGRFSMTYTRQLPETSRESASGQFTLYKDRTRVKLDLATPLGQIFAQASHRQGEAAVLRTQDGRSLEGRSLDDVFERAIGIRIPAEKLPDWLSDRFEQVLERSADGQRIRATDSGWQIDRQGGRWDLVWHEGPRRIDVRLIVDAD